MKKVIFFLFILSTISFSSYIKQFDASFYVNKNGSVDVIEDIFFVPESENKHGITKFIPIVHDKNQKIGIRISEILLNNEPVNFKKTVKELLELKIGSKDIFLDTNKVYKYTIKYKLYNVLRQKEDFTYFYINAIGQYWDMPIENANVIIKNFNGDVRAYKGAYGSVKAQKYNIDNDEININSSLNDYEGITVIVENKNFVYSQYDKMYNQLIAYLGDIIFISIAILSIIFLIFAFLYRKHKKIKTDIVSYKTDFSPTCCSVVENMDKIKADYADEIIVYVFEMVDKGIIGYDKDSHKYYFNKDYENQDDENYIKLSKLKALDDIFAKRNYEKLAVIVYDVNKEYKNWYLINSKHVNYTLFTILYIFIMYKVYFMLPTLVISKVILIFSVAPIYLATLILSKINIPNQNLKEDIIKIKSYKNFLEVAQKNEFDYFKDPEDLIKYFRKIIPYAIAFGLENKYFDILKNLLNSMGQKEYNIGISYYELYMLRNIVQNNQMYYQNTNNNSFKSFRSGSGSYGGGGGFSGGGFSGGGGSSW